MHVVVVLERALALAGLLLLALLPLFPVPLLDLQPLLLELLCVRGTRDRDWVMLYFSHWLQEGGKWRESVERSLQGFVSVDHGPRVVNTC